jgi:hypothetical protein
MTFRHLRRRGKKTYQVWLCHICGKIINPGKRMKNYERKEKMRRELKTTLINNSQENEETTGKKIKETI